MERTREEVRMLAEIPWIERQSVTSYTRLEDTSFYKKIGDKCSLEEKIRRLQLFWMLSETFPFYLPQRYHAMDCLSLHKNSKDGNYWANATVFLFNNAGCGHKFLEKTQSFLQSGTPDLKFLKQLTSVYKDMKQTYLKDNLEECASAAEFLLEPWVLLQLPLQPMITYQWAVALLVEACKFQKEIADITAFVSTKRLSISAKKLTEFHSKMLQCAHSNLEVVFCYAKLSGPKQLNYQQYLQVFNRIGKNPVLHRYADIIPIVEFVLSPKCRDVIKALKRLASNSTKNIKNSICVESLEPRKSLSLNSIFNYQMFWQSESRIDDLKPETITQDEMPGIARYTGCTEYTSKENLEKFVDEKLIPLGKLKGLGNLKKEDILKCVGGMSIQLGPLFSKYQTLKERLSECVEAKKAGIINRCISHQIEADMAMILALIAKLVIAGVKVPQEMGLPSQVDECQINPPGLTLRQVIGVISSIRPDQNWNYKNILKRVKASFDEKLMEYPDYEQGAEKMAIHLQERIRRIVFKMINQHYKSLNEEVFVLYPECQTVQFILPCFVASFLDLDKDPSASVETKKKYLQFVFEMVKSYETREFTHELKIQAETVPFAFAANSELSTRITSRCVSVEKILRQMLSGSKVFDAFFLKGMSSKFYLDAMFEDNFSLLDKITGWQFAVFMLNARMRSALKKIGLNVDSEQLLYESQIFTNLILPTKKSYEQKLIFAAFSALFETPAAKSWNDVQKNCFLISVLDLPAPLAEDIIAIPKLKYQGLLLYLIVKHLKWDKLQFHEHEIFQGPGFPLDPVDSTLWSLFSKDMLKFKIQVANILTLREKNEDPSLAHFDLAKNNYCYRSIMKFITPEGKVDMSKPGEITLFPVKHCRWCGKVRVKEFRVCPICAETPDYPDLNFFCSENCEKEALEKQHEQEHCNFLLEECGF